MSEQPSTEVERAGGEIMIPGDAVLAEELEAERSLWRSVFLYALVAVPICIVIWCAMVAIAVGPEDPEDWFAWLGIGVIVGILAGAFFGGWAGFLAKSHILDDVDHRASQH